MKDILSEIVARKRHEVREKKLLIPVTQLEGIIEQQPRKCRSMKDALLVSNTGIIAEFKRKSPSKSWINEGASIEKIAPDYETNGATAISVLTDTSFFGGSLNDLRTARQHVSTPLLRKEFIVDEYQIFEAKAAGADAVLLIAAVLSPLQSKDFTRLAKELGMDVLLEIHNEIEADYVTINNDVIGVNNRNLGSFETNVEKSFKLINLLPKDAVLISESGISDPNVVKQLRNIGYKGFLIGENFMKTGDPGRSLSEFISEIENEC